MMNILDELFNPLIEQLQRANATLYHCKEFYESIAREIAMLEQLKQQLSERISNIRDRFPQAISKNAEELIEEVVKEIIGEKKK